MGFLLKGVFWFSAVLLVLPVLDGSENGGDETAAGIDYGQTVQALAIAVSDVQAICQRHPDVCETGSRTLEALGDQARDGALIAYRYLGGAVEPGNEATPVSAEADPRVTGTVAGTESAIAPTGFPGDRDVLPAQRAEYSPVPTPSMPPVIR